MPYNDVTPHLEARLLYPGQSGKEYTVNDALLAIDALLNCGALSRDIADPPSSPAEGDVYIPASPATGVWLGKESALAYYAAGSWRFLQPKQGLAVYCAAEGVSLTYTGSYWQQTPVYLQNVPLLGVNATADATNKLAVSSAAMLFTHEGADCRLTVNKNAESDVALQTFQTGFSGRAEIGLNGSDNFGVKVSPDGSTWLEVIVVDKSTGKPTLKNIALFQDGSAATPGIGFDAEQATGCFRPAAGAIGFSSGGSETMRVAASGVSFDGGGNYLGNYGEGTWTPALGANKVGDYNNATSVTVEYARYERVGNFCRCTCGFTVNGITGAAFSAPSSLTVTGLPFAPRNLSSSAIDGSGVSGFVYRSIGSATNSLLTGGVSNSGSSFHFFVFLSGGNEADNTDAHHLTVNYFI